MANMLLSKAREGLLISRAASKYLAQLTEMGILQEATVGKYHLFTNHKLLQILSK